MGKLDNQVALVTGSSRGIGKAIAVELARAGSRVVVNYLTAQREADETGEEIRRLGSEAAIVQADVSQAAQVSRLVKSAFEAFGHVDILVNNAGVYFSAPLDRLDEAAWEKITDTNMKSAYLCCQALAAPMLAQGHGSIVNITSTAGLYGSPRSPAYAASKAGMMALTRSLAQSLAPTIRVNAVAAGWIEGGQSSGLAAEIRHKIEMQTPLRRFGQPEEIANLVRFLVSEQHFMTGQVLSADGGLGVVNWFAWP